MRVERRQQSTAGHLPNLGHLIVAPRDEPFSARGEGDGGNPGTVALEDGDLAAGPGVAYSTGRLGSTDRDPFAAGRNRHRINPGAGLVDPVQFADARRV